MGECCLRYWQVKLERKKASVDRRLVLDWLRGGREVDACDVMPSCAMAMTEAKAPNSPCRMLP
jgi:hypothetical protein